MSLHSSSSCGTDESEAPLGNKPLQNRSMFCYMPKKIKEKCDSETFKNEQKQKNFSGKGSYSKGRVSTPPGGRPGPELHRRPELEL